MLTQVLGTPPSTRRAAPVMKAAAGESRKTTAAESSASVPMRFKGTNFGISANRLRVSRSS